MPGAEGFPPKRPNVSKGRDAPTRITPINGRHAAMRAAKNVKMKLPYIQGLYISLTHGYLLLGRQRPILILTASTGISLILITVFPHSATTASPAQSGSIQALNQFTRRVLPTSTT